MKNKLVKVLVIVSALVGAGALVCAIIRTTKGNGSFVENLKYIFATV